MNIKLEKVFERDIDLLLINKLTNDTSFKNIFLKKINRVGYDIISINHSFTDENGESDICVILQLNNKKIALLIEDKINAIAMPNQRTRYNIRGNSGISNNLFDEFFVFIIAPEKYLETNIEARKYENKISYEELCLLLEKDLYATALLKQAIEEKKKGYVVIENKAVTSFWKEYYSYIKQNYPHLNFNERLGARGSKSIWPEFKTPVKSVNIIHKSNKGYVDLSFSNQSKNYKNFYEKVKPYLEDNMQIARAGKSLVVRMKVPTIDFNQTFSSQNQEIISSLDAITKLVDILSKFDFYSL